MADKTLPAVPPRILKTQPFPSPYALALAPSKQLQDSLDFAIATAPFAGKDWRVAISIVEVVVDGPNLFAGFRQHEQHYSASLLKVAAMYAAYELRARARALAVEIGATSKKDLFADMAAHFDPIIVAKAATIDALSRASSVPPEKSLQKAHCVPAYETIFDATADKSGVFSSVELSKIEDEALRGAILVSDNASAARCIHNVGYGYLNGALASAGFFDPATNKGIWLAGDYVQQWPYFRIPSVNDKDVAQATTTHQLARLYTLIARQELVDIVSSKQMQDRLAEPAHGVPPLYSKEAFIDQVGKCNDYEGDKDLTPASLNFLLTETKVGLGDLKPTGQGPKVFVYSEGSILFHTQDPLGRRFVVVWQNAASNTRDLCAVIRVVRDALNIYTSPVTESSGATG